MDLFKDKMAMSFTQIVRELTLKLEILLKKKKENSPAFPFQILSNWLERCVHGDPDIFISQIYDDVPVCCLALLGPC